MLVVCSAFVNFVNEERVTTTQSRVNYLPPVTGLFHEAQLRRNPTYSRRRSVSIAARSAGSVTPTARATWPHRIARRT